jgi:two-component system, NarL family, nitrate/nitrite response regulator NarL
MQAEIQVLIADDHPVVRIGLRQLLQSEAGFKVVGESADGRDTLAMVRRLKPHVLLLDVAMPGLSGLEVLRALLREPGPTRVILLTAGIEQQQLAEAVELGARGVVLKDSAARDVAAAVRAVSNGQCWIGRQSVGNLVQMFQQRARAAVERESFGLTPRELQVIATVAAGSTNMDIAHALSISEDTVKRHLTHIFDKVGVSNRLELGLFAVHHHLVTS